MKIQKIVTLIGLCLLFLGCGASKKVYEANATLDDMMQQKRFDISIRTAEPMVTQALAQIANSGMLPPGNSISRIDVTGAGWFIKVAGDSVSANLPYYGEQQMGGGYNSDKGIKFDGLAKNFEIVKNEAKQNYQVNFSVDASSSENFFVTIDVGNRLSAITTIRSSYRNRIRYSGNATAIDEIP